GGFFYTFWLIDGFARPFSANHRKSALGCQRTRTECPGEWPELSRAGDDDAGADLPKAPGRPDQLPCLPIRYSIDGLGSRNVPLTAPNFGDERRTATDDASR